MCSITRTVAPARAGIFAGTLVLALLTSPSSATERLWVGPDGGYFVDFKNWAPGGVPSGIDFALFDYGFGGVLDVAFFGDPPAHTTLMIRQGDVQFNLAGHTYSTTSTLAGIVVADTPFSPPCSLTVNGGVVNTDNAFIGLGADATGTLTLMPSTQWLATGQMLVGWFGDGSLVVSGPEAQSLLSTQGGRVGPFAGSDGTATVSGTFGQWANVGDLTIGEAGTGALSISSAGTVSTTLLMTIGDDAGGDGEVTVSGFGSTLSSGFDMRIGNFGTASLRVEGGGTASSSSNGHVCFSHGSSASVVVTGPGSTWHCDNWIYVAPVGSGAVVVEDGGTVSAGVNVTVGTFGSLHGDGLVDTAVVTNNGFIAPGRISGDTTGTLTVDAGYVQAQGGELGIEMSGTGAGQLDVLAVTGEAHLGGTLTVAYVDGFLPEIGDSFILLTAGTVVGEFDDLDATPPPNTQFCLIYGATTVELRVVSSADLNCDFQVNVTDLLSLLAAWGTVAADITGDGMTDVVDLLALLAAWGV